MSLPGVLSRASGRGVSQEGDTEHSGNYKEDRMCRKECQQVRLEWQERRDQVAESLSGSTEGLWS